MFCELAVGGEFAEEFAHRNAVSRWFAGDAEQVVVHAGVLERLGRVLAQVTSNKHQPPRHDRNDSQDRQAGAEEGESCDADIHEDSDDSGAGENGDRRRSASQYAQVGAASTKLPVNQGQSCQ